MTHEELAHRIRCNRSIGSVEIIEIASMLPDPSWPKIQLVRDALFEVLWDTSPGARALVQILDAYKSAKLAHDEENFRIELARNDVRHNEIYQRCIDWMHKNE